jgi:hypothetical protein
MTQNLFHQLVTSHILQRSFIYHNLFENFLRLPQDVSLCVCVCVCVCARVCETNFPIHESGKQDAIKEKHLFLSTQMGNDLR